MEHFCVSLSSFKISYPSNDLHKRNLNLDRLKLTLNAFTNSLNGKLFSCDGSGIFSPLLPLDLDLVLSMSIVIPVFDWNYCQNSLFLRTIFFKSSNVMTTG
jgi:hypothetical protein